MNAILNSIQNEFVEASLKFSAFHSLHEGYAVLLEEVDELWEHVKMKQGEREPKEITMEQTAIRL